MSTSTWSMVRSMCLVQIGVYPDRRLCSYANSSLFSVVKNPLSPIEHPGGVGVNNELFEESLEQFVVCTS